MTRCRMAKILSCASCLSSYSMYLSQKGCARKSRPTQVAARSKSLRAEVSKKQLQQGDSEGEVGQEGKYRRRDYASNCSDSKTIRLERGVEDTTRTFKVKQMTL